MKHEPRWPVLVAVLCCGVLNWWLPDSMSAGPGWLIVLLTLVLGIGSMLTVGRGPEWFHLTLAYAMQVVVTASLAYALSSLVKDLIAHRGKPEEILGTAASIWGMNVLVFATWYWRMDGGGPSGRHQHESYREGAFLFPQATLSAETKRMMNTGNWHPQFIDYLFLSFNASTAFSPTDTPVLSRWAKAAMMVESLIALTTVALVAARAVNIL